MLDKFLVCSSFEAAKNYGRGPIPIYLRITVSTVSQKNYPLKKHFAIPKDGTSVQKEYLEQRKAWALNSYLDAAQKHSGSEGHLIEAIKR